MAILLPGWIKQKKNSVLTFEPSNPKHPQGALQTAERRLFIVEKSADMRYNKLLNFAGVTGDFDDSRFRERNAYEKWKKT